MFEKYVINGETLETPPISTGRGASPVMIFTSGTWQGIIKIKVCLEGDSEFTDIPDYSYNENFMESLVWMPQYTDLKVYFSMHATGEAIIRVRC